MTDQEKASVAASHHHKGLSEKVNQLFREAANEVFEDGMDTVFSNEFMLLAKEYGAEVIEIASNLILQERVKPDPAIETLHCIGKIDDSATHTQRRSILSTILLQSRSPQIRDGSAVGLAYMDDPEAIPYLEQAIKQETIDDLRKDMKQVLDQLQATLLEQTT